MSDPVDPADAEALDALFKRAFDIAPDRRKQWLDALSGPEARLRDALRDRLILANALDAEPIATQLDPSATVSGIKWIPAENDKRPAWTAGVDIGPYRLLAQIGEGGMGSVWLAERTDGILKRPVALKLPRGAGGVVRRRRTNGERTGDSRVFEPP